MAKRRPFFFLMSYWGLVTKQNAVGFLKNEIVTKLKYVSDRSGGGGERKREGDANCGLKICTGREKKNTHIHKRGHFLLKRISSSANRTFAIL